MAREHRRARTGATEARTEEWFAAMRWRRWVELVVTEVGLTFTQWLVLEGTEQLTAKMKDAAIQNEIAAWLELDRKTVSQVIGALEKKGLIGREVDYTGKARRVALDPPGTLILRHVRARVEVVSADSDG